MEVEEIVARGRGEAVVSLPSTLCSLPKQPQRLTFPVRFLNMLADSFDLTSLIDQSLYQTLLLWPDLKLGQELCLNRQSSHLFSVKIVAVVNAWVHILTWR